ncbi:MAG TPA: NTP transferase domain-containing protein [Planctomycetota bacterium]|nr:NTP transferase domain-containing protein [Planctomycetota bacterium]
MVALTAVILAAGVNRRLGRTPVPKSLLPLMRTEARPSFLERHVAILRELGVGEVRVVLSEPARGSCPDFEGMRIVVNTFDTSETGSTLSMLCALRGGTTPADHGLLIMDADIVYERALMRWVIDHCGASSCLFTAPATAGDDEEVRVYGVDSGDPRFIGKGLVPDMTRDMKLLGESLGVIHVAPRDLAFLRATSEWLAGWGQERKAFGYSKARSEHEEAWQYFFAARRMRIAQVPADLLYTECDTQEDYDFVRDELYPAILAQDSKQP